MRIKKETSKLIYKEEKRRIKTLILSFGGFGVDLKYDIRKSTNVSINAKMFILRII